MEKCCRATYDMNTIVSKAVHALKSIATLVFRFRNHKGNEICTINAIINKCSR